MRRLRVHGGLTEYQHVEVGLNSRIDAIQAAVLRASCRTWMAGPTRAQKAQNYSHLLEGAKLSFRLDPPFIKPDSRHIFHQYVVRVPDHRDALMEHLKARDATKIYYPIRCTCRSASHTWATKKASFRKPREPRWKLLLCRSSRTHCAATDPANRNT